MKLRLTLFWHSFFLFRLCLADSPMVISGRIWSSHPCGLFVKHEIQMAAMKSPKTYFEQQAIIFLSGTTIKHILPSFDIIIMPKMLQ